MRTVKQTVISNEDIFAVICCQRLYDTIKELVESRVVKGCQLVFVSVRKRNDKLVQLNFKGYARMSLDKAVPPALLSYERMSYPYMAPVAFTSPAAAYAGEHLRSLA